MSLVAGFKQGRQAGRLTKAIYLYISRAGRHGEYVLLACCSIYTRKRISGYIFTNNFLVGEGEKRVIKKI